jgi:hypothetical protein
MTVLSVMRSATRMRANPNSLFRQNQVRAFSALQGSPIVEELKGQIKELALQRAPLVQELKKSQAVVHETRADQVFGGRTILISGGTRDQGGSGFWG